MTHKTSRNENKWKLHGDSLLQLAVQFMRDAPVENYFHLQNNFPFGCGMELFKDYRQDSPPLENDLLEAEINRTISENLDEDLIERKLGLSSICQELWKDSPRYEQKNELKLENGEESISLPDSISEEIDLFTEPNLLMEPSLILAASEYKKKTIEKEMVKGVSKSNLAIDFKMDLKQIVQPVHPCDDENIESLITELTHFSLEYFRTIFDPDYDQRVKKRNSLQKTPKKRKRRRPLNRSHNTSKVIRCSWLRKGSTYFVPMSELGKVTRTPFIKTARKVAEVLVELYEFLTKSGFSYENLTDDEIFSLLKIMDPEPAEVLRLKGENSVFEKNLRRYNGEKQPEVIERLVLKQSPGTPEHLAKMDQKEQQKDSNKKKITEPNSFGDFDLYDIKNTIDNDFGLLEEEKDRICENLNSQQNLPLDYLLSSSSDVINENPSETDGNGETKGPKPIAPEKIINAQEKIINAQEKIINAPEMRNSTERNPAKIYQNGQPIIYHSERMNVCLPNQYNRLPVYSPLTRQYPLQRKAVSNLPPAPPGPAPPHALPVNQPSRNEVTYSPTFHHARDLKRPSHDIPYSIPPAKMVRMYSFTPKNPSFKDLEMAPPLQRSYAPVFNGQIRARNMCDYKGFTGAKTPVNQMNQFQPQANRKIGLNSTMLSSFIEQQRAGLKMSGFPCAKLVGREQTTVDMAMSNQRQQIRRVGRSYIAPPPPPLPVR